MTERQRLPNRRPLIREYVWWPHQVGPGALEVLGRKIYIDAGIDPRSGKVLEVFARGGSKHGERIDFGLDAIAIALSRRLQHGETLLELADRAPTELAAHLLPDEPTELQRLTARAVVGAIIHRLIQIECDIGAELPRVIAEGAR